MDEPPQDTDGEKDDALEALLTLEYVCVAIVCLLSMLASMALILSRHATLKPLKHKSVYRDVVAIVALADFWNASFWCAQFVWFLLDPPIDRQDKSTLPLHFCSLSHLLPLLHFCFPSPFFVVYLEFIYTFSHLDSRADRIAGRGGRISYTIKRLYNVHRLLLGEYFAAV
jgi:hypothetical protein